MVTIGLHIRLIESMLQVLTKAQRLQLPFFQCFLVQQGNNRIIQLNDSEIQAIQKERAEYAGDLYLHGSYWINLAHTKRSNHRALQREVQLAEQLGFNHIVLHPGATKDSTRRLDGVDAVARVLNNFFSQNHTIKIVLENAAHGGMSVGGNFEDFKLLREKLDKPELVSFCVDTAHAHVFGYDIITQKGQDEFITMLDQTIGLTNISLIHLNDTQEGIGSKIDRHAAPGDGIIGIEVLKRFVCHQKLSNIRVLMELPVMEEKEEIQVLDMVRSWPR